MNLLVEVRTETETILTAGDCSKNQRGKAASAFVDWIQESRWESQVGEMRDNNVIFRLSYPYVVIFRPQIHCILITIDS